MKKSLAAIAIIGAAALALTGCAGGAGGGGGEDDGVITVGFAQTGSESGWRAANTESMKEAFSAENGFELGKSVFVSFSPERVDPANEVFKTRNTPKVIGGATPACLEVTRALYSHIIDTLVPVSSTETAEMVKLLENTFRAVNIGLANEIAIPGTPSVTASIAAETVPEYNTSSPMLGPRFTPEKTKSGCSGMRAPRPSRTQSVGVPSTWNEPSCRR